MALRKTLRVLSECFVENLLARGVERVRMAAMHGRRCHEADSGVAMLVVVPSEEGLAEPARVLNGFEACREVGLVLQRFELRFRVRIVVADVRPAVALGDA